MNTSLPELQQACFELEVFIGDRPVGIIEWHQDSVLFQYYPGTRDTDFVSLLMPVRSQPYFSPLPGVLPPVFDMNLPEGSLRQTLVGRYGKVVQGFNDLALLRLVGRNSIGRLAFGMPLSPAPSPALDLDAVMQANDEEALLQQLFAGDAVFSGVAGVQPKVLASVSAQQLQKLSDEQAPGQDLKTTLRADHLIIKTGSAQTPWIAANEFYCLRAAHHSGLPTPVTRLLRGGQILAVERFDRRIVNQALVHLGAEDFCALSGMLSVHKYDGTYERAARTLTSLVSPAFSHQSRRGLFHTLALASVLRNGDAHLKNFTLLYTGAQNGEGPEVWLSPTYDLCTTNAYLPADMLALWQAGLSASLPASIN